MRIAIIGGGITGLAAAHRIRELQPDVEVQLFEATDRLGGVIATERRNGFVLERGPDSIITDKPWGMDLARRLGLEDQMIGTQNQHRRSFVVRDGKLMPVPEGFHLLAPSKFGPLAATPIFSWTGKARMAMDLVIPRRTASGDESLGDFVIRRLGREALDRIAQPMIAGIYGADPMKLSLQATMPRFLQMERDHGSVIRAMWTQARKRPSAGSNGNPAANGDSGSGVSGARYGLFISFREGMQTLTDALIDRLPAGCARLNTRVQSITRKDGQWELLLSDTGLTLVDRVILALPAPLSGVLLSPLDGDLGALLNGIPYASSATISLCYQREEVPHPLNGFGFVVPTRENLSMMGCTFTNVKYPHRAPEGVALLRAFLSEAALEGRDDPTLEAAVRKDLQGLLGITAAPSFSLISRQPKSMAQYAVGHLDRVAEIEKHSSELPGLALAGNGYRGIGIPDCIHSGELAAEAMLAA